MPLGLALWRSDRTTVPADARWWAMHADWDTFFAAEAGAAAALTGLFFVAISINISEIVHDQVLPGRAGETIAMLTGALIVAGLLVIPDQSLRSSGVEVLAVGTVTWLIPLAVQSRAARLGKLDRGRSFPFRVAVAQAATLPAVLGGVLLIVGSTAGLALLAVGILATFVVSILNAWVLLIEILR